MKSPKYNTKALCLDKHIPSKDWLVRASLLYDEILVDSMFEKLFKDNLLSELFYLVAGDDKSFEFLMDLGTKSDIFDTKRLEKAKYSYKENIINKMKDMADMLKEPQSMDHEKFLKKFKTALTFVPRNVLIEELDCEVSRLRYEMKESDNREEARKRILNRIGDVKLKEVTRRNFHFETYVCDEWFREKLPDVTIFASVEGREKKIAGTVFSAIENSLEVTIPINSENVDADQIIEFRERQAETNHKENFIEEAESKFKKIVETSSKEDFEKILKKCQNLMEKKLKEIKNNYQKTKIEVAVKTMGIAAISSGPTYLMSLLNSSLFTPLISSAWITSSLILAGKQIMNLKEKGELDIENSKWAYLYYLDKEFSG